MTYQPQTSQINRTFELQGVDIFFSTSGTPEMSKINEGAGLPLLGKTLKHL
jgi:hypothetical protein